MSMADTGALSGLDTTVNKWFGSLAARLSLILIGLTLVFMAAFTVYLAGDRSNEMNEMILDKGISAASTGAIVMGRTLDGIIDEGLFTTNEVFDRALVPIELPAGITGGYAAADPGLLSGVQKYHYATGLDSYLDNAILEIEDEFLKDPQIVFAVLVDGNGYLPAHNSIYSQRLTGDFAPDRDNNRTKRLFDDAVGLAAAQNTSQPYLKQVYQRDTGEEMWDISSPVYVKGRHWGAFRIGLSMDKTAQTIAALRWKIVLPMGLLMLILVVAINRVTAVLMRPLVTLRGSAERMETGDLEEDEITRLGQSRGSDEVSSLSRVFSKMAAEVKAREAKLKKQVTELKIEIDHSKKARQVAEITDTDYFQNLKQKAKEMRERKGG